MAVIDSSYNEKRDFIRMKVNSKVDIVHAGNKYQAICKDLSGVGMLLETDHSFAIGSQLKISISAQGENQLPFNATADVSRITDSTGGKFIIGLSIKSIE